MLLLYIFLLSLSFSFVFILQVFLMSLKKRRRKKTYKQCKNQWLVLIRKHMLAIGLLDHPVFFFRKRSNWTTKWDLWRNFSTLSFKCLLMRRLQQAVVLLLNKAVKLTDWLTDKWPSKKTGSEEKKTLRLYISQPVISHSSYDMIGGKKSPNDIIIV